MTSGNEMEPLTVEQLAVDCIDVRELNRAGLLKDRSVTFRPFLRWPKIVTMRADRYVIQINLLNQVVPQYVHLSWTQCHLGGARPWLFCPHCRKRVARLFKGMGGYFCRDPGKERRQIVKTIAGLQIATGGVSAPLALDTHPTPRTTTDGFQGFQSGGARHVQTP